jgi:hypothetical protein
MPSKKSLTRKTWPICRGILVRNRLFTQSELVAIRRLIRSHPHWGRTRVSQAVCELLSWRQPNGRPKERACRVALVHFERRGLLKLPRKLLQRGGRPPIFGNLRLRPSIPELTAMPRVIQCNLVDNHPSSRLWNSLIGSFHYLGVATPVGRLLRYLVYGDGELIAAISFTECAWKLALRDAILAAAGLDIVDLHNRLIANNRFLVLPNVRVPNLASRTLAAALNVARHDWIERFEVEPLVAETFVDPRRFEGTCYRAANWVVAGSTRGFAKRGACHVQRKCP